MRSRRQTPLVVAVLPAHNEQESLGLAIASLRAQTLRVDGIIVVADNCTDATEEIGAALGCTVSPTVGNTKKKAGALNQVLPKIIAGLRGDDLVLVMDADSQLGPEFIETAVSELTKDATLGAVGGVFYGLAGHGIIGQLQRNEYTRYSREIARRKGKAVVLTGTGTVFRVSALRAVQAARGARLPGEAGLVYDTLALTEDNEMTLAMKTLGYRCLSPKACRVTTEIMPDRISLWNQRLRWQRGALENLKNYGFNRVTAPYIGKQAMMHLGVVMLWLYVGLTVTALSLQSGLKLSPFWLGIGLLFLTERIVTVWSAGRKARWIAAVLVIEAGYDLFLQAVYLRALWDILLRRQSRWHHVGEEVTT
jgi:cellulose synthase/poly-beta-1,6-N-acetylglucosamine synthase-like glycosyltransferase